MSIVRRQTKNRGTVYDVRLRDASGRVYTRTFRTKKLAARFEAMELADRARGAWIDPRRASDRLADVAAEWLASNPRKKGSSVARDTSIVTNHIVPRLARTPWSDNSRRRTTTRQPLVDEAWRSYGTTPVRRVQRHHDVRTGLRPNRSFPMPAHPPPRTGFRPPYDPDARGAPPPCDAVGSDTSGMVYLAALLGLRWGECAGLRVGGIDFTNRMVSVETQLTRGIRGHMVTGAPKWNSVRTVAAPDGLLRLLDNHLAGRGVSHESKNTLVFSRPMGSPSTTPTGVGGSGCRHVGKLVWTASSSRCSARRTQP